MAFFILLCLTFVVGLGCIRAPEERPNVILIVVDTLRADHLNCYGYDENTAPNIDRLAQRSALFLQAYSSSSWTRAAVASILTSKYPIEHGIMSESPKNILHSDFVTIPEVFSKYGYDTGLIYTNPHYEFGLKQGFDYTDYTKDGKAELVYGKAEDWLKKEDGRPFFLMIHNNDPHDGYAFHRGFSRYPRNSPFRKLQPYFPPRRIGENDNKNYSSNQVIRLQGKDLKEMIGNYDDEIRYLDHYFGVFLDYLDRSGLMKNTIVILTSDHGDEFLDHGGYWHGFTLYNELIHVPLVFYIPHVGPRVVREKVGTLDIYPTLLDLCGMKKNKQALPADSQSSPLNLLLFGIFLCLLQPLSLLLFSFPDKQIEQSKS